MLSIVVPLEEGFDETTNSFVNLQEFNLELEHSLVSLSKWESKHEKPFLQEEDKSLEETVDYIKFMVKTPNVPAIVFNHLTQENYDEIGEYINAKMTATWFSEVGKKPNEKKETVTAEVIYYWMVTLTIPFTCEDWHLNRLLTLIRVCNEKNQPEKKMSKAEIAARNRELNAQRKVKYKTQG